MNNTTNAMSTDERIKLADWLAGWTPDKDGDMAPLLKASDRDLIVAALRAPEAADAGRQFPCDECDNETSCINRASCHDAEAADAGAVALVPLEPTEEMWGGLARDIVMWTRFDRPSEKSLLSHLKSSGTVIPDWLSAECKDRDVVPPKGSVAVWIYKAMLAVRPVCPTAAGTAAPRKMPTVGELEALLNSEDYRPVRILPDGSVVDAAPPASSADAVISEDEAMRRLSANEVACYRWPDDTVIHKAMRNAFMDGAALSAPVAGADTGVRERYK